MGFQFIHVETYSMAGSNQKKSGKSNGCKNVRDVFAESGREPGSCNHVENPEPPAILYGSLENAENEAAEWAEQATDAKGRKLRKDGHCLLAGVISLPRAEEKKWDQFVNVSMEYLKEKYGDRLKSVISHKNDEEHPHIHFYVVPRKGERFETIHEGQQASKLAKVENKPKGLQNLAYIEAMRSFQDDFSKKVGQVLGLTRLGPGRRRLSRKAWLAEQAQAKALANVEKTAQKRREHYKAQGLKAGRQQAEDEAKAIGAKLGGVLEGFKGRWHQPSSKALEEAERVKKDAKEYADRVKEQAIREVQDEKNKRRMLDAEIEKQRNIAKNLEIENNRLKAELTTTDADRQRLLKDANAGSRGSIKIK